MNSTGTPMTMEQELREINEALLISSLHQHERSPFSKFDLDN